MISFASLFLGLVFGLLNVELVTSRDVARVELLLDGTRVAELRAPWKTTLDVGCDPAPHELVAVAFDARGTELGRAHQWINRPRAVAEAGFVLEPGKGGRGRIARLTWRCLTSEHPRSVSVTFDGKPVPVSDPGRIEIPSHVPEQAHFLRAELEFEGNVSAVADAVFGGSRGDGTLSDMTAVPVTLGKGVTLPPVEDLEGWFATSSGPLDTAALEEGPGNVVFVCEGSALGELAWVLGGVRDPRAADFAGDVDFRFLWPVVQSKPQSTMVSNIYPITRRFTKADGGINRVAMQLVKWPAYPPKGQRIADAVAVAALSASEQERRRAVVLVLGPKAADASLLSPEEAAGFLEKLRVPLVVWSVRRTRAPDSSGWKNAVGITSWREFEAAVADLSRTLQSQRIAWVEGTHLPQSIVLGPAAEGIQLAH